MKITITKEWLAQNRACHNSTQIWAEKTISDSDDAEWKSVGDVSWFVRHLFTKAELKDLRRRVLLVVRRHTKYGAAVRGRLAAVSIQQDVLLADLFSLLWELHNELHEIGGGSKYAQDILTRMLWKIWAKRPPSERILEDLCQ